ncbi:MAG: DUF1015 family protein [Deltaproteobacteria bacterium]|nr:DUF1015 family protein [Deltaproteobacteria bacterium]
MSVFRPVRAHRPAADSARHLAAPELDAATLRAWRAEGRFSPEAEATFYVYQLRQAGHEQRGVVGAASVEALDRRRIRRLEAPREVAEEEEARKLEEAGAVRGLVTLTYAASPAVEEALESVTRFEPEYDFISQAGVQHTFWTARGEAVGRLTRAMDEVPFFYVVDRPELAGAASRVQKRRRERRSVGPHDWFLAHAVPDSSLRALPVHRVALALGGMLPATLLEKLGWAFHVEPVADGRPAAPGHFGLYVEGRWYRLEPREEVLPSAVAARVDAALLQKLVVGPLLGVREPLDSPLLESVAGDRDIPGLQRKVDEGAARAVLLLHPPSVPSLLAAADAGHVLPPGSFRVDPQPLAGLALHVLD